MVARFSRPRLPRKAEPTSPRTGSEIWKVNVKPVKRLNVALSKPSVSAEGAILGGYEPLWEKRIRLRCLRSQEFCWSGESSFSLALDEEGAKRV